MPDVRYYKQFLAEYKKKYKKEFHETKTIELQRFLDRIEFYADRCALEPRIESQNYRWFEYNNAVRSAIRIWEKYSDCSEPPTNNPDPLNGLEELKKWAIKELRNAGVNTEQKLKQAGEQKKEAKQQTQPSGGNAGDTSGGKTGSQSIDSQNKHEDIIELKPNFCGIGLNINALIRKRKCLGIKIKNLRKAFIYRILLHKRKCCLNRPEKGQVKNDK